MDPLELKEIARLVKGMNDAVGSFKERIDSELTTLRSEVRELVLRSQRPGLGGGFGGGGGRLPQTEEAKAMDRGFRALIAGDKAAADAAFTEAKAMNTGTGHEGGYMVSTMFSDGFTKVMAEVSPVYRLARVIQLNPGDGDFEEPVDRDQAEANWVGEQSSRPETGTPDLGMFYVSLEEVYAMPKVSQRMVDLSSMNVMDWLQTKVGEAFATKESASFHSGDGVSKPRGFLTHNIVSTPDATRTWGELQYVPSGHATAFASTNPADALIDMTTALRTQYRSGAVWLMNRTTAGVVRKFKDSEGRYVWVDSLLAGQPATLLGYPVMEDEDMPDLGANAYPVAFGNFKRAYTIIEKPGIKFLPDPFTAKPHVILYSYRRVGGAVNNSEAIKLLKCATI